MITPVNKKTKAERVMALSFCAISSHMFPINISPPRWLQARVYTQNNQEFILAKIQNADIYFNSITLLIALYIPLLNNCYKLWWFPPGDMPLPYTCTLNQRACQYQSMLWRWMNLYRQEHSRRRCQKCWICRPDKPNILFRPILRSRLL